MPAVSPQRRVIAVMLLVPTLVALALWAFAWPAARMAPRDLPIGVAGPEAAAARVEQGLLQREGAFAVQRYADEAAARAAIQDREAYGAVVAGPEGLRLLTASAAGPAVAQLLQQAARTQGAGGQVSVTDVAPTPSADPRGGALAASVLPVGLAGMAGGAVVTLLGLRGVRGVTALAGAAVGAGLVGAALAHSWLGVLSGSWWAVAGALSVTVLAIGAGVSGLAALLGRAGLGLGALVMVLLGNSFSGAAGAPELLPEPVGAIGQILPPGAGASLLRSVAFFDGAAAGGPLVVLALWVLPGLAAVLVGSRRAAAVLDDRATAGRTTPEPAPIG